MSWFALNDRVSGTYLRRDTAGVIIHIDFARAPYALQYTVKLDQPVKVTSDGSALEFTRARVSVTLNEDGQSVDSKNRPDTIARFAKSTVQNLG